MKYDENADFQSFQVIKQRKKSPDEGKLSKRPPELQANPTALYRSPNYYKKNS